MRRNMGTLDRAVRAFVIAPIAVAAAVLVGAGTTLGIILLVIAGLMLVTAVVGFCVVYTLFGFSTEHLGIQRGGPRGTYT